MFTTSVLITIQIPYVKQLPFAVAGLYFVAYGFFDGNCSFMCNCQAVIQNSVCHVRFILGRIVKEDTAGGLGTAYDGCCSVSSLVLLFEKCRSRWKIDAQMGFDGILELGQGVYITHHVSLTLIDVFL